MAKHNQFVGKFPTNCLDVFDHFVGLALELNFKISFGWCHSSLVERHSLWNYFQLIWHEILDANNVRQSKKQSSGGVLKNFAKFTGKHRCLGFFFNEVPGWGLDEVAGWGLQFYWNGDSSTDVFLWFCKFFRTPFS